MPALACALLSALALLTAPAAWAQPPAPDAAEVKAAIVQRLLGFVRWPGDKVPAPITLCVRDEDAVAQALRARPPAPGLRLRPAPAADAAGCDALYAAMPQAAPGVLTLSDGAASAGMVRLDVDGGRVVFDVDLALTRSAGLEISSHLLRLARRVHGLESAP